MKKILTHLTGIVFLITILVAGGCKTNKQNAEAIEGNEPVIEETLTESDFSAEILAADSNEVWVSLQETSIGCRKHLVMQNITHSERSKKVIDTLTTVVYPGYTVRWVKADSAKLKKVHHVRILDSSPWNTSDSCLAGEEVVTFEGNYIKFVIPSDADTGTVKYEIIFEDKDKIFLVYRSIFKDST